MFFYIGLLLLVTAVSLDGLGVGISYGLQKIKLPLESLFIIVCCSSVIVIISMTLGHAITQFISEDATSKIGGLLLISIGLFTLKNTIKNKDSTRHKEQEHSLQKLIYSPIDADKDKSGKISAKESVVLGIALALDAFGAGIGAAIIGYEPLMTALCIGLMSGTFVFLGMKLGLFFRRQRKLTKIRFLAPVLLITLGLFNVLF